MCNRYVTPEPAQAEREFGVNRDWWKFSPSFNVGPSRNVPVIRKHDDDIEGVMLYWGLIPEWAEADASKACVTHTAARMVSQSTATRSSWERGRRCILPMFGFYTWQLTSDRHRQPFFVRMVNRAVFGVAALWDRTMTEHGDDVIESCTLITVPPNSLMAELQGDMTEMPAILQRKDYRAWLNASAAGAESVLRACPQDQMVAHPVSPRINSLSHDDVQLIRPIEDPAAKSA